MKPPVPARTRRLKILPCPGPQKFNTFNTFNTFNGFTIFPLLCVPAVRRGVAPAVCAPSECACITRVRCLLEHAVRIPNLRAGYLWTP